MNRKIVLLFAIIASIEFVHTVPIAGDLTEVLNTDLLGGHRGADPNGVLYGFRDLLDNPLCGVGLGCDDCEGPLSGLQPTLGGTINSLGLGSDCRGKRCGQKKVPIEHGNKGGGCNSDGNHDGHGIVDVEVGGKHNRNGNHDGHDCDHHGIVDVEVGGKPNRNEGECE